MKQRKTLEKPKLKRNNLTYRVPNIRMVNVNIGVWVSLDELRPISPTDTPYSLSLQWSDDSIFLNFGTLVGDRLTMYNYGSVHGDLRQLHRARCIALCQDLGYVVVCQTTMCVPLEMTTRQGGGETSFGKFAQRICVRGGENPGCLCKEVSGERLVSFFPIALSVCSPVQ